MSKVIDITDKLSFDKNPRIIIRGDELEVNADAPTVLKIMGMLGEKENPTSNDVIKMYELIFSKANRGKIEKMNLQFNDFQTIVFAAINLIIGEEEQPGEQ